jgi:hypothetical protein
MTAVHPSPGLTGQLVDGRYRVGERIGHGAMSDVYAAEDERLGRTVALKALRPGVTDHERFAEETALMCALDHPHLVRLHDAGEHDGVPYLVLNLVHRSLAEALAAGPMSHDAVARIGREIASALDYLHGRSIVHRDVKPSNVLLREDGSACLADLGAALSIDGPRLTATGLTVGTPMYLAPEQALGDEVGPPADVYSLGLVLIEAATGRPVFQGSQQEAIAARVVRAPEVPDSVPRPFAHVLEGMVAVDPALRPSAADVGDGLSSLAPFGGSPVASESDAAFDETAVMSPPTLVGHVPAPPTADTDVLAPRPGAVVPAWRRAGDRVAGWVRTDRDRAALLALAVVMAAGLLLGLASRSGFPATPAGNVSTTTPTTVPPTTAAPTTAPPAPVVEQPQERDEGGGNGRAGEENKDGRKKQDDD